MSDKNSSLGCSSVSDGQMEYFFRLKGLGIINRDNFGKFLENPKRLDSLCTVDYAIATLGKERVVTYRKSCKAWKQNVITPKPSLYYSQATIENAAKTNKSGVTDYYLVYCHGFSLLELSKSGHFSQLWWAHFDEASWCTKKYQPGYYLLNMRTGLGASTWAEQEVEIVNSQKFERAGGGIVCEALFTIYKITGLRLLKDCYHWSELKCTDNEFVCLGYFDGNGMAVQSQKATISIADRVRVVRFRKYDDLK